MKRILALILSLILCFGFIVSCEKEEEQSSVPTSTPTSEAPSSSEPTQETPSSSEPPVSEEPSSREPSITNFQEPTTETLDGITREFFDSAYTAYTDVYYPIAGANDDLRVKVVTSYEEFLNGAPQGVEHNYITEETFEDNFVILINGLSGHLRPEDIYYTDFKKADGYYILTYNLVQVGDLVSPMEDRYADICVVPIALCEDDLSTVDVKIILKYYQFLGGKMYESSCNVITCLPKVD